MNVKTRQDTAGLLLFNAGYIYRRLRKESQRLNIKWNVLTLLKDIELLCPVTQKTLAKENHMSGPSVSVLINTMIESGWVNRTQNANDKRSSTISLTNRGKKKLESEGTLLQESLVALLKNLGEREVEALQRSEYAFSQLFRS